MKISTTESISGYQIIENLGTVIGVRFQTSMILQGTAELLVYGTAVKIIKE